MNKFNQAKFESKAKRLVAKYLNYQIDEKELSIIWFSKVGADAKVMICDMDNHCFEVTCFGEDEEYIVNVYSYVECDESDEEELKGSNTSHVLIGVDKTQTSLVDKIQISDETKCPICQEQHNVWGLTEAFQLHIKDDILFMKDKSVHSDVQFPKDAFKIKYCPFCGRPLNKE